MSEPLEEPLDDLQDGSSDESPDDPDTEEEKAIVPSGGPGGTGAKRGRPRKKFKSQIPLRILNIDFSKPPADQLLPCSDIEQSVDLGWAVDDVRAVNQSHGLYEMLPMVCKGEACFWAKRCPTRPDFLFQDYPCPLQVIEAYTRFVELVKELEVKPDDNVDLDFIADLVRIDLQMKELDMQIAVDGQMTEIPHTLWQKTGEIKLAKGLHPALKRQSELRKDRNEIYAKLIASRADKKKAEAQEGKREADLLSLFAKAMEKGQQYQQQAGGSGPTDVIIDVLPQTELPGGLSDGDGEGPDAPDPDDFF